MIRFRWFILGLLVVAFFAAAEAAPKLVLLGGLTPRPGSIVDNGSYGLSVAAEQLVAAGARVAVGLSPPPQWRGPIVYIVAGPMNCSGAAAEALARTVKSLAARGVDVGLVVASSGPYYGLCGRPLLEALGAPPLLLGETMGSPLIVPLEGGLLVLYRPDAALSHLGWSVVATGLGAGGSGPAVLAWSRGRVRVVFVPEWDALSNWLLRAEERAGINPGPGVVSLVELAVGTRSLRGVLVLQPAMFLPQPPGGGGLLFQPGILAARLAEAYKGLEDRLYAEMIYNPFAVMAVASVAATALYAAWASGSGTRSVTERPPKPEHMRGRDALAEAAAVADQALRILYGVGLREAASRSDVASRLAEATGMPRRRVQVLLRRLAEGRPPRLLRRRFIAQAVEFAERLAALAAGEAR